MNKSTITLIMLFVSISFSQVNTIYYDGTECQCDSIKSEYYTESGRLFSETSYVNDKQNGIQKGYYKDGKLLWEIPYVNGKENGIYKGYYDDGKLLWETSYVNGKRI